MTECMALAGATVYTSPDDEPLRDGVVVIAGSVIDAVGPRGGVAVPPGTRVLDCSGLAITAGFWNSHVHFFERKWADAAAIPAEELGAQLEQMLTRYGFTSVFDLTSLWANTRLLRARIESGEVAGPDIRSTGEGLIPSGGAPSDDTNRVMGLMKTPLLEVADAAEAAAAARSLLEAGVDGIKMFVSSPRAAPLAEATMRAAADEAHRAGKPVFAHPNNAADIAAAVGAGVDIIAHTGAWDPQVLAEMRSRGVAVTPTLRLWKYFTRHDRLSVQQKVTDSYGRHFRTWVESGGEVLFGTDLGAVDYDPTEEYDLMHGAGMNFRQILASLTTAPARRFGDGLRTGRVAAGYNADLVMLEGNPAVDIHALARVRRTLRGGRIIYDAAQATAPSSGPRPSAAADTRTA